MSWLEAHGLPPVSLYPQAMESPWHALRDGPDSAEPIELELAEVLSPSQVSSVMDCPYRWYAKYGLEIPDVQTSNQQGSTPGSATGSGLRYPSPT